MTKVQIQMQLQMQIQLQIQMLILMLMLMLMLTLMLMLMLMLMLIHLHLRIHTEIRVQMGIRFPMKIQEHHGHLERFELPSIVFSTRLVRPSQSSACLRLPDKDSDKKIRVRTAQSHSKSENYGTLPARFHGHAHQYRSDLEQKGADSLATWKAQ